MDVIDFAKRVWQNRPSVATPIDAAALNRLEDAVDSVVDRLNDPDAMASQDKDDYVARWLPATAFTAGQMVISPTGQVIARIADGTSGASYDPTEQALWTVIADPNAAAAAAAAAQAAAGAAMGMSLVFGA